MAKNKRKNRKKKEVEETGRASAIRPTIERLRRSTSWADPKGTMKSTQPIVDMASDAVGRLHSKGLIDSSQEQAARLFQELRANYISELPDVAGYKSCIAGSIPGFDDGDGDAVIVARYRSLEATVGSDRPVVLAVCEENRIPTIQSLPRLRNALDRIAGVDGRGRLG